MIGAPNYLNLNCKVRVMKEAPGPLVSEEIADIFTNYNIDTTMVESTVRCLLLIELRASEHRDEEENKKTLYKTSFA